DLTALRPADEQRRPHTLREQHARTPRRLPALLRPHNDRTSVEERRQQPARVRPRVRLDPVVVHRAEELPTVEHKRLALIHATRHLAVLLNPVSDEETERVQRIEVQGELVSHQTRPSSGHATTDAASPPPTPSRRHARQPHPTRPSSPSPPDQPSKN